MSSGTVAVLGAHATVDNMYIYIYIYPPHPRLRGEPGVLRSRCKFLQDLEGQAGTLHCRMRTPIRFTFFFKNRTKTEPPKNQPKVWKWVPQGPPNGAQNRQNLQKCNLRERSKAGTKNNIQKWDFRVCAGGWNVAKVCECCQKHTFQGWPQGRQIVSQMPPKRRLLRATLASKGTKML